MIDDVNKLVLDGNNILQRVSGGVGVCWPTKEFSALDLVRMEISMMHNSLRVILPITCSRHEFLFFQRLSREPTCERWVCW